MWTRDTNVSSELSLPSCALGAFCSKICVQLTPCYSQPHLSSSPEFFRPLALQCCLWVESPGLLGVLWQFLSSQTQIRRAFTRLHFTLNCVPGSCSHIRISLMFPKCQTCQMCNGNASANAPASLQDAARAPGGRCDSSGNVTFGMPPKCLEGVQLQVLEHRKAAEG